AGAVRRLWLAPIRAHPAAFSVRSRRQPSDAMREGSAMNALITLVAVGLFAAAGCAGIIGVASVAIRREEKDLTLTREATGAVTRAGRVLNGVYVSVTRPTPAPDRAT